MKTILCFFSFLLLLAGFSAGQNQGAKKSGGKSLLTNGGFEGGVLAFVGNWITSAPSTAGVKAGVDPNDVFDGEQSGALQNYNPKVAVPLSFSQTVPAATVQKWIGRELALSAAIRTEDASFADVRIEGYDARGKPVDALSVTGGGLQGTNAWKRSEARLLVPTNVSTLVVRCVLEGTGTAWFDKVELIPLSLAESKAASPMIDQIRDLLGQYLRASKNSKEEKEAKESLQGASLEALVAAVSRGFLYGKLAWGSSEEQSFDGSRSWSYRVTLPSKAPEEGKAAPLLLDLKAAEGTKEPWSSVPGASSWFIARPKSRLTPDSKLPRAIVEWVQDLGRKFPVDRNRVFLVGWKESSAAAGAAALSYRGEFAGAILMHPTALPSTSIAGNAEGLPFFLAGEGGEESVVGGGASFWKGRKAALTIRDLDPSRDPYVAIGEDVLRWCEGKMRPAVDPFEEVLTSAEAMGSYWIEVLQFAGDGTEGNEGRVKAKIHAGNQVELEASGVKKLRLLLDPKRFDLTKPLKVRGV